MLGYLFFFFLLLLKELGKVRRGGGGGNGAGKYTQAAAGGAPHLLAFQSEEVGQRSINQSWEILGEIQPGAEGEAFLGNLVNY